MTPLLGIHHVTAICGDPQSNVDFYAGLLGLRLVKKTVNFDDPGSYHLYYGDRFGAPGTLLTFFAWPSAPRGQAGPGEPVALTLEVPVGSLDWWAKRLKAANVLTASRRVFGTELLSLHDPDGMRVDLTEPIRDPQTFYSAAGGVPQERAVKAIASVTLSLRHPAVSNALYTSELGFKDAGSEDNINRFEVAGSHVDVEPPPSGNRGRLGAGSIHHVAFRTADDASQHAWLHKLTQLGLHVSPVMDRKYFHSIYFREPGGVLFEIATDGPGMLVDESDEQLGNHLALPSEYERLRSQLEMSLPPVQTPEVAVEVSRA